MKVLGNHYFKTTIEQRCIIVMRIVAVSVDLMKMQISSSGGTYQKAMILIE